jgi:glycosyltransferase involved in cell wall biosynthesis
MRHSKPLVSVIVCTYNRAHKIKQCLDALVNQSFDSYEIIVVNDGSVDNTATVLSDYKFKVITNSPNQGASQSRNIGVAAARADILVFTDDDCIADKHWLKNLVLAYADPKIIAVGGRIVPYSIDKWLLKYYEANNPLAHLPLSLANSSRLTYRLIQYLKRSLSLNQLPNEEVELLTIVGANMSMRRSVFTKIGGFDKNFRLGGDEEDLWKRVHSIVPGVLLYAPRAVIKHDYDSSYRDALRRNYTYGFGSSRLFLKYHDRIPAIYPFPIVLLLSLLLMIVSPYFILLTMLLFILLYPGWVIAAVRDRRPLYVFYSIIQASLEFVTSVGFARGYINIRRQPNFTNSSVGSEL